MWVLYDLSDDYITQLAGIQCFPVENTRMVAKSSS